MKGALGLSAFAQQLINGSRLDVYEITDEIMRLDSNKGHSPYGERNHSGRLG
jgi:hypothetical protein